MDLTMHNNHRRPHMGGDQEASGDGAPPYTYYHVPVSPITVHDHHSVYARSLADHREARAEIANDNSLNSSLIIRIRLIYMRVQFPTSIFH